MNSDFFNWIGEQIGRALRAVIDSLGWILSNIFGALDAFYTGLANELGIGDSLTALILLIVGLLFLYASLRRLLAARFISAAVWALLAVLLIGWLMG